MGGVRFELSELPPRARAQAEAQIRAREAALQTPRQDKKPPKYRNERTEKTLSDGKRLNFDSRKEARRYDELMLMLAAGQIEDLRLQEDITIQEAYTTPEGERIRAIRYKADFTYWELDGDGHRLRKVVEDTKSRPTRTKEYVMKKKLLKERFGINIVEVYQC